MVDHFFKVLTSLRNCNLASSPALRLGGAAEQLSGLCFQKRPTPSGTMILTALCATSCLDRAPLRFAPRSTVLPAWLAPLAAKRSVASLPHNETGHTWSHLVTTGHKLIFGHRWSHGSYPSHQISQWERDISPDRHTDRNTHYTVLKGRRLLYRLSA